MSHIIGQSREFRIVKINKPALLSSIYLLFSIYHILLVCNSKTVEVYSCTCIIYTLYFMYLPIHNLTYYTHNSTYINTIYFV